MAKKIKFKDINGVDRSIVAADVEQFSHHFDKDTGKDCTHIEIDGEHIFADCHLADFTAALFATT